MMDNNGEKLELVKGLAKLEGKFEEFADSIKTKFDTAFAYNRDEHKVFFEKLDKVSDGCLLAVETKKEVNSHKEYADRHIGILYKTFTGTIIVILLTIAGWIIKGK